MRLLVHLRYYVHVATDFSNHGVNIIDLIVLLLLIWIRVLLQLQFLNLSILLLDDFHEIADLICMVVAHRIQVLLQLLSVPCFHLLNLENVDHVG